MKRLPFWIVSWAASAVLFGALQGSHFLAAVNVYAWFICVVMAINALSSVFSAEFRKKTAEDWRGRPRLVKVVSIVTPLLFLASLAHHGWIVMFGTLLVCWLVVSAGRHAD